MSVPDRRPFLRHLLVTILCLGVAAYFASHAIGGRYGLSARAAVAERRALIEFELAGLEITRTALDRDVALLSPAKPDPDLVEEIARDVLGFARPDDVVIIEP